MKMVIFGLTVSSSWGNGHATLWRGLQGALARRGWTVVFFERDRPYYAETRDLDRLPGGELLLYRDWSEVAPLARRHLIDADVSVVTSYCPDGIVASDLVSGTGSGIRVFYDLDTPVTLARLRRGEGAAYIGPRGLRDFDLVLSYTGGPALAELRVRLGARRTAPLYGHVDPRAYHPGKGEERFRADLSYIGTYAEDRQAALEELFVVPARERPEARFVLAGAQYPQTFPWTENIHFVRHLPPDQHPEFYASSRLTLSVTRRDMAAMGWCPSGRLFEAAACGAAMISDWWPGLEEFFEPDREILIAESHAEVLAALALPDAALRRIGDNARQRVLAEHTSAHRALQLETILSAVKRRQEQRAAARMGTEAWQCGA